MKSYTMKVVFRVEANVKIHAENHEQARAIAETCLAMHYKPEICGNQGKARELAEFKKDPILPIDFECEMHNSPYGIVVISETNIKRKS